MAYRINYSGSFWSDGVFCVPKKVAEKSLKFANETQLKVLLLLLDGTSPDAESLSKRLSRSASEIEECLEFWLGEGILISDDFIAPEIKAPAEEPQKKILENLPMPSLSPRDIVALCAENSELANLLRGAEKVLSSSLSNSMKSNIINMVTYYGLPVPVVLTLLEYYKSERDNGKNITTRTLQNLAKEWAQEEVDSLEAASAKIEELSAVEELWADILSLCEFDFRKPTSAQKKMLIRWRCDFSREMIFFACNTMKKYTEESLRSLKQVDNILKEWKRKGLKTPEDVKSQPADSGKKQKSDKLKTKPSFDVEKLKKRAELNDKFDV